MIFLSPPEGGTFRFCCLAELWGLRERLQVGPNQPCDLEHMGVNAPRSPRWTRVEEPFATSVRISGKGVG